MTNTIDNTADILDSRDVIARIRELEADDNRSEEEKQELADLLKLAEEGEDASRDWEHGETLIQESYFVEYAKELAEDCGTVPRAGKDAWPLYCIDWDRAARELRYDYSAIDFAGVTYLIRSS